MLLQKVLVLTVLTILSNIDRSAMRKIGYDLVPTNRYGGNVRAVNGCLAATSC